MKPGRNDLCSCGSGRKYKKCCGEVAAPNAADQLFAKAQLEHRAGRLERAEQLYHQILAVAMPANDACRADALHMLGLLEREAGHNPQAAELIRQAISVQSSFAPYHNNLGAVLKSMGLLDEAVLEFQTAIRLMPGYVDALVNFGGALIDLGKPEEALQHLEQAVELSPASVLAHANLGLALHALNRSEEGLRHVLKGVDLNPESVVAVRSCAGVLAGLKRGVEAVLYFERWVAMEPRNFNPYQGLGYCLGEQSRWEEAVPQYRKAIALIAEGGGTGHPALVPCHGNLGIALKMMRQLEEAAAEFRETITLAPDYVDALVNLGGVLVDLGKPQEAQAYLVKALELNPSHVIAQTNLSLTLHALGKSDEALELSRKTINLAPESLEAVRVHAGVLSALKLWPEAVPYFEQWIALDPENSAAYEGLGYCYLGLNLFQKAAAQYCKALEIAPGSVDAANNLGVCLGKEGHRSESLTFYRMAVGLRPEEANSWVNMGVATKALGQLETALRCLNMALALDPKHAGAHWNRSMCLLALGRLAEGWADYDWGLTTGARKPMRPFSQPRWEGSDPTGKTILVWMEQGLGDHILFASLLPDLIHDGAKCIVECDWRLAPLFARSFPGAVCVPVLEPPHPLTQQADIDYQIPAGSLPRWLRPSLESFPQHRGFLIPDPLRAGVWRERIDAIGPGLRVGICWRSMLHKGERSMYYSQLNQWGPILATSGVHFINLQYDECEEELREAERLFGTPIHRWNDLNLKRDQEGVAALISTLDLVLSAGTAVDQLSGALGIPTWVLMRGTTDWWGFGTDRCPWYPSIRSFPCGAKDPWEPVIEYVASEVGSNQLERQEECIVI